MKVYFDTNIWIDIILERIPFYVDAYKVLLAVAERGGCVATSTLSMATVQFICHDRGKMDSAEILHKWESFSGIMDVCEVTAENIFKAYSIGWNDVEDGIQYLAARDWSADVILTRNKKDFQDSDIPVLTPQEYLSAWRRNDE